MKPVLRVFPDPDALAEAAARLFAETVESVVGDRGRFALALSGGNTPRRLYRRLAERDDGSLPWHAVHVFWGDERCVPPDHEESNYRMAREELLSRVSIPEENIRRIPGEKGPRAAAISYDEMLQEFFGDEIPTFDLILLGMGTDGHTASLFPGAPLDQAGGGRVMAVQAPPGSAVRDRVTLTLAAINSARRVWFLVTGEGKRRVARAVLHDPEASGRRYPAAHVRPEAGPAWFLDAAAAGDPG
jgi:6-phosphogluconolactonase